MELNGLNLFGSLTMRNGEKITKEDALKYGDTNNDGQLSTAEIDKLFNDNGIDTLHLSTMDTDKDGVITDDEFKNYETKALIQEELEAIKAQIATDFVGELAQYSSAIISDLVNFVNQYVQNDNLNVEDFKEALSAEYEALKDKYLAQTPTAIAEQGLDIAYNNLLNNLENSVSLPNDIKQAVLDAIGKKLEALAHAYVKANPSATAEEVATYLEQQMALSDAERMTDAKAAWDAGVSGLGWISSNDLKTVKNLAKELLTKALEKGIVIQLGGKNIATEAAITSALAAYSDGQALINDLNQALEALSTKSLTQTIIDTKIAEAEAKEAEKVNNLKGSDVQIGADDIDYHAIDGYYSNETITWNAFSYGKNNKIITKGKEDAQTRINELKEQIKNGVIKDLEALGIPFEKFEVLFEKVFTESIAVTLEKCLSIKDQLLNVFDKVTFNVKDLIDTFITTFNELLAQNIDQMNASQSDMDLMDIDPSLMEADEEKLTYTSNPMASSNKRENYRINKTDELAKTANRMLDRLKDTMLAKAKALCEANGVEFNQAKFDEIFANSKQIATTAAISSKRIKKMWRDKMEVTLNDTTLFNTFTTTFKENYTVWVDSQKK